MISWVALALERTFCVDTVAVSTQPSVLTLIDVAASFAVCRWEEAFIAQAAISTREVLTAAVRTDARFLTLIDVITDAGSSFMTRQTRYALIGAWCVLTLLIGACVRAETLIYVFTGWMTVGFALKATVTFTFIGSRKVHTLTSYSTDVLLRALIHIYTLESPMLYHVFIALTTEAFVASFYVDAKTSAMTTRL